MDGWGEGGEPVLCRGAALPQGRRLRSSFEHSGDFWRRSLK